MSGLITVKWRGRELAVPEADWRACRRIENGVALLALMAAGGLVVAGLDVAGLQQVGVALAIIAGLAYFDGYVSRFCASRKAGR
jgi:hypothetical protein